MITPSFNEFKRKAGEANIIPVYSETWADTETPVSVYLKLKSRDYSFLLESAEGEEKIGRYSFIGLSPRFIFSSKGKKVTIFKEGKIIKSEEVLNPLEALKTFLRRFRIARDTNLPRFIGGAVGYLSYDMVRFMEVIPELAVDDLSLPDAVFIIPYELIIFDHLNRTMKIVALVDTGDGGGKELKRKYREASLVIQKTLHTLKHPLPTGDGEKFKAPPARPWRSNFTRQGFMEAVKKVKAYIRAGDIVQAVISQRYESSLRVPPFRIYRALRYINPSPFMFYLDYGKLQLIGSSPEVMLRREGEMVEVRPIAGTRRRGETPEEDRALAKELLASPKERAEHIMLVDLGRNDLGRVSKYGTVIVNNLMSIERYSHVMHIVSDVVGKILPAKDEFDALKACFPAGTVTGAPKIRAMEIIEELEPTRRGPYAGAVGYFSFSGNLDTCITIRTVIIKDKQAYIQAGAGIVEDSDPAFEYEETRNKARAMMEAVKMANA